MGGGAGASSGATSDQRPAAAGGPRRDSRPGRGRAAERRAAARPGPTAAAAAGPRPPGDEGAQRRQRVVGDVAGPDQVPEGGQDGGLVVGLVGGGGGLRPARARTTPPARPGGPAGRRAPSPSGGVAGGGDQERRLVAEDQPDPAVGGADAAGADPHHLAGGAEGVEVGRASRRRSGPAARRPRATDAGSAAPCSTPSTSTSPSRPRRGRPTPCHWGRNRARARRRRPVRPRGAGPPASVDAAEPQHVVVAPLPLDAVGPELAPHHPAGGLELVERRLHPERLDPEGGGGAGGEERTVGAGVAGDQLDQRCRHGIGEGGGQTERDGAAQRIAQAGGVVGRGQARLAGDGDLDGPAFGDQRGDPAVDDLGGRLGAGGQPVAGEGPDHPQQVVGLVGVTGPAAVDQALQLRLEVGQHAGVDEVAQLLGAEQLAQQVAVERQGGGPPLGQRGVALVHVDGDPPEEQRLGEGRGPRGVDGDDPHLPGPQVARAAPAGPAGRRRR